MINSNEIERQTERRNGERTEVEPAAAKARQKAKENKYPGLSLLVHKQDEFAATLAARTGLDYLVIAAWCLAEESSSAAASRESEGNNNWLNIGYFDSGAGAIAFNSAFKSPITGANQTDAFLRGTWGGAVQGIRDILNTVHQGPEQQMAAIASSGWATSTYDHGATLRTLYKQLQGVTPGAPVTPGAAGTTAGSPASGASGSPFPTKTFTRGSTTNPDEDSWEQISDTARAEGWFAPTDGNTLFYMDGPQLAAQHPELYIDVPANRIRKYGPDGKLITETGALLIPLTGTFDNTAFIYRVGHKLKGRVQRRSRIGKPSTPSEIKLSILCDITDFRAGGVVVFENSGPLNGVWIIANATRKCLTDPFTKLILQPPVAPKNLEESSEPGKEAPASNGSSAESVPGGSAVPTAAWNPSSKPIANWIIPILKWAAANGWTGTVTSGYRTAAEQEAAAASYAAQLGKPISAIYPNGPLASNHCGVNYPRGAVDVTSAEQLNNVLKRYPGKPTLVWAELTIEDGVHFSSDGH